MEIQTNPDVRNIVEVTNEAYSNLKSQKQNSSKKFIAAEVIKIAGVDLSLTKNVDFYTTVERDGFDEAKLDKEKFGSSENRTQILDDERMVQTLAGLELQAQKKYTGGLKKEEMKVGIGIGTNPFTSSSTALSDEVSRKYIDTISYKDSGLNILSVQFGNEVAAGTVISEIGLFYVENSTTTLISVILLKTTRIKVEDTALIIKVDDSMEFQS